MAKCTKLTLSFPELGAGALSSHQQLPGSTRQSQTGLSSRQELDLGMHGSTSGSGLQAEQRAEFSSEANHGRRREWHPHYPPALTWVWHTRHGIPSWSLLGHKFCPPLPANATLYDSSLAGPKRSISDLDCYRNNYKQGPFSPLPSYR